MTDRATNLTDQQIGDLRARAHEAAAAKLWAIYSGQIPNWVAHQIADAVLNAVGLNVETDD